MNAAFLWPQKVVVISLLLSPFPLDHMRISSDRNPALSNVLNSESASYMLSRTSIQRKEINVSLRLLYTVIYAYLHPRFLFVFYPSSDLADLLETSCKHSSYPHLHEKIWIHLYIHIPIIFKGLECDSLEVDILNTKCCTTVGECPGDFRVLVELNFQSTPTRFTSLSYPYRNPFEWCNA
jgi:hypothetical protein